MYGTGFDPVVHLNLVSHQGDRAPRLLELMPSKIFSTYVNGEKRKRLEMLSDERPKECDYCWNVEDNSDRFSDRVLKSCSSWSLPYYDEIKDLYWRENYNPKYVEVAFSNACNFKCSYC